MACRYEQSTVNFENSSQALVSESPLVKEMRELRLQIEELTARSERSSQNSHFLALKAMNLAMNAKLALGK